MTNKTIPVELNDRDIVSAYISENRNYAVLSFEPDNMPQNKISLTLQDLYKLTEQMEKEKTYDLVDDSHKCMYSKQGNKYVVLEELNANEVIVREVWVDDYIEFMLLDKQVKNKSVLFEKQPTNYRDNQIAKQERTISALTDQVEYTRNKIKEVDTRLDMVKTIEKSLTGMGIMNPEQQDYIAKVVQGKMTHVITTTRIGVPKINSLEEECLYYDRWGGRGIEGLKLLTLWGNSGGDVAFRLSQYRDDSGNCHEVEFFTCRDDAQKRQAVLTKEMLYSDRPSVYDTCLEEVLTNPYIMDEERNLVKKILMDKYQEELDNADKNRKQAIGNIERRYEKVLKTEI